TETLQRSLVQVNLIEPFLLRS
ncbi:unnamed protein product, partial [Rotaria sp. Silwood2]